MTKKHFEALAAALRESRQACGDLRQVEQWRRDVEAVILAHSQSDPVFDSGDRARFLKACGVEV
jgi:hypothetical protein